MNRAVQPQKRASGLKVRIKKVVGLYDLCGENKGADKLACAFVLAYAKQFFS